VISVLGVDRLPLCFLLVVSSMLVAAPQQTPTASPQRALLNQYCVGCHNDRLKTAGLALNAVSVENVDQNPEVWEKVIRKVRARSMPPVGIPRPAEASYDALASYLETSLDRVAAAKPNPGRTDTFRRLNRTEYQNAIRDLLALDVDVASLLPSDDSSHGFDNITVGELSPTLLERYLTAAQKISRLAMGSPVRSPGGDTIVLPPDLTQEEHFDELPFGTRGGTAVRYSFPQDAEYEIQLRLARDRNEHVEGLTEAHQIEVMLDGERVQVFTVTPPPPSEDHHGVDKDLHVRIPVKAGPHELGVAFLKKPSALLETERQPYQAHFNLDRHPRVQPALYSISVVGPYDASGAGDTTSRRRILVCTPAKPSEEESCAKRIFAGLTKRAYRRPVTDADLQMPLKFYKEGRTAGGFEGGIEMALRALLVSPEFLFRVEQDPTGVPPNTAYRLSDLEVASRLSFFLWSSIPDDELLDVAIRGKLKEPAVLEQQVRRMLADPRSEALVNSFADQWLYLRNLASATPDARLFPDFDDNLRQSMRRETELFFESIMRQDRNLLDLLTANYTFLNERLAKHYGIPNVYGSHFRRVEFGEDRVRGGLLGQGSILTVTSYANRTSPVIRGKWILTNILGAPPPPPPPNVPPLKDGNSSGKVLTMRERMAQHRSNPPCAGCHQLMDPVGFSLENYDAVGRWRTNEGGTPIDASGNLPDGSKFAGASGLRQTLLNRPELFVISTTEKLLTYAVGRGLESYDAAAVRKIVRDARGSDYRFSSLILGIVNSTPFQMRRSQ
jgi:mono/diheme cytochrome c family protein